MCGNIVADYYKIIWLEEKRYFHEIIFLDYIFKFLHAYCICSRLINMCRGLRSLTWACAFIAFNYTIFLWFIYSGIFRESSIISNRMSCLHCAIPAVINMVIIIIACFVDGFYSINDAGKFLRGKYYEFLFIIPAVYITISTAALFLKKSPAEAKDMLC